MGRFVAPIQRGGWRRHLKQPISGYGGLSRVRLKDSIPGVIVNRLGATRQRSADFIGQRQS